MIDNLLHEKLKLESHLNWLGIRSTGSDRIERRIREIEREVKRRQMKLISASFKPPDSSPVPFEYRC